MDKIITADVVKKCMCSRKTAELWAMNNGVELIARRYFWSEDDVKRFMARPKPGKRAKKKPAEGQPEKPQD